MAIGYEDAARKQGSQGNRYGSNLNPRERMVNNAQARGQSIDDRGNRVYTDPSGRQQTMSPGFEQEMRTAFKDANIRDVNQSIQDALDQEQNRVDEYRNRAIGGMSADQQLETAITNRARGRAEREGLDYWNALNTGTRTMAPDYTDPRERALRESFDKAKLDQARYQYGRFPRTAQEESYTVGGRR